MKRSFVTSVTWEHIKGRGNMKGCEGNEERESCKFE